MLHHLLMLSVYSCQLFSSGYFTSISTSTTLSSWQWVVMARAHCRRRVAENEEKDKKDEEDRAQQQQKAEWKAEREYIHETFRRRQQDQAWQRRQQQQLRQPAKGLRQRPKSAQRGDSASVATSPYKPPLGKLWPSLNKLPLCKIGSFTLMWINVSKVWDCSSDQDGPLKQQHLILPRSYDNQNESIFLAGTSMNRFHSVSSLSLASTTVSDPNSSTHEHRLQATWWSCRFVL